MKLKPGIRYFQPASVHPLSVTVDAKSWTREEMATCIVMRLRRLQGLAIFSHKTSFRSEKDWKKGCTVQTPVLSLMHAHMDTAHLACGILYMLYTSTLTVFDQK